MQQEKLGHVMMLVWCLIAFLFSKKNTPFSFPGSVYILLFLVGIKLSQTKGIP